MHLGTRASHEAKLSRRERKRLRGEQQQGPPGAPSLLDRSASSPLDSIPSREELKLLRRQAGHAPHSSTEHRTQSGKQIIESKPSSAVILQEVVQREGHKVQSLDAKFPLARLFDLGHVSETTFLTPSHPVSFTEIMAGEPKGGEQADIVPIGRADVALQEPPSRRPALLRKLEGQQLHEGQITVLLKGTRVLHHLDDLMTVVKHQCSPKHFAIAIGHIPKLLQGNNNPEEIALGYDLMYDLYHNLLEHLPKLDVRALITGAWGIAKLQPEDGRSMVSTMLQRIRDRPSMLEEADAQGLAALAWTLGSVHLKDAKLMGYLSEQVVGRASDLSDQGLSNMAWCMGILGHKDEPLLRVITAEVLERSHRSPVSMHSMSTLMWGWARVAAPDPLLIGEMTSHVLKSLHDCQPQATTKILWSLAALGHYDAGFMDEAAEQILHDLVGYQADQLATIAAAYAALRHWAPHLFTALTRQVSANMNYLRASSAVELLVALAHINFNDESLSQNMGRALTQQHIRSCSVAALAEVAAAVAVLGWEQLPVGGHVVAAVRGLRPGQVSDVGLIQLFKMHLSWQAALDAGKVVAEGVLGDELLSPPLAREAELKWRREVQQAPLPAALNSLEAGLQLLGLPATTGALTADGLFLVACRVEWRGRSLALDLASLEQMAANTPGHVLGELQLRGRLLAARGLTHVVLPPHERGQLLSEQDWATYVSAKLDTLDGTMAAHR